MLHSLLTRSQVKAAPVTKKAAAKPRGRAAAPKNAPGPSPLGDATNRTAGGSSAASGSAASTGRGKKTVEQIYQKKSQLEHILLRPDSYVGSIESITQPMWTWDSEAGRLVHRPVTYVPGLLKIFDEIIVNAADNKQRDASMDRLSVEIDAESGTIRVENTGRGIPVVMHKEHKCYVPELIFGHLLTSSNYDDGEKKVTGGRNGYGAKLANIFSTTFVVETADSSTGLYYRQEFHDNMTARDEAEVEPAAAGAEDFTAITFTPELHRFGMDALDADTLSLMYKRVYDMAGIMPSSVKVQLNGKRLNVSGFKGYCKAACQTVSAPSEASEEPEVVYLRVNERWQVAVSLSDGQFQQLSYVNAIATIKGGTHVNYVADQVAKYVAAAASKKTKGAAVKAHQVKNHLCVMVNCLVENPAFDSQTKETLTTVAKKFGSTCELPDSFLKAVAKAGVIERVLSWVKFKASAELKRGSGKKSKNIVGIPKLDDANFAGSAQAHKCTLILTEGDSAKALAVAGLSIIGRDHYGVFPLKGKLLNVREASVAQIKANEEVQNLVKIMGLQFGKSYDNVKSLRYGHIMIMTDQDYDGSHIKGLLINFLHHFWPSLLRLKGFLREFVTPIVKVTRSSNSRSFFTIPEYMAWREANNGGAGWGIRYYKGLGTSSAAEAREYFSDLPTHVLDFTWAGAADDAIDLAFNKKRADDRKDWLLGCTEEVFVDHSAATLSMIDFVHKELILFSRADNVRSLPCVVDGLKPAQRKVLFACFKRNLHSAIKVAQLAGYVAEHSAYHHGEASLAGTIVGMAQDYVGSNNVNLLVPSGQFGTRLMGGKDAASPRYIFTLLSAAARAIFHPDDDALLDYQEEDGQRIEPQWYMPVIPLLLVNGSDGIGTGWSTSVPTYNPAHVIANLERMLDGAAPLQMTPWFRGYQGDITAKAPKKGTPEGAEPSAFSVSGHAWVEFDEDGETLLRITELPVRKWVSDYKAFLESLMANSDKDAPKSKGKGKGKAKSDTEQSPALVKSFRENHTDTRVDFSVVLTPAGVEAVRTPSSLRSSFKLGGSVSTTNMNCFDADGQIVKYRTATAVLRSFFALRMRYYEKRKAHKLGMLANEWERLDNKARFISEVLSGELIIANKKKAVLLRELKTRGYKQFPKAGGAAADDDEVDAGDTADVAALSRGYTYLLQMPMWSLTQEKVNALRAEVEQKELELAKLRGTTPADLWRTDLNALKDVLRDMFPDDAVDGTGFVGQAAEAPPSSPAAGDRATADDDDDEDDEDDDELSVPRTASPVDDVEDADSDASSVAPAPAPRKRGAASKAKPAAKATKAKRAPARKAAAAAVVDSDSDDSDSDGMPSLAARLAARMQVSPPPVAKRAVARRSKATAAVVVDSEDDSEDDFAPAPVVGKKRTAAAERASKAPASKAKPKAKTSAAVAASPLKRSPVAKRSRGGRKAAAKPAQPVFEEASFDDSDSDVVVATPPPRANRSRRAAAKAAVVVDSPAWDSASTASDFDEDSDDFYDSD